MLIKQECIPVGCVASAAVAAGGGVLTGGVWGGDGVVGCLPGGVCPGGGVCPVHAGIHIPPVNRITDASENKTLQQLRCGW